MGHLSHLLEQHVRSKDRWLDNMIEHHKDICRVRALPRQQLEEELLKHIIQKKEEDNGTTERATDS